MIERCVPLEPAAEAVCDAGAVPPLIFQLPPAQGREVLEKAQDAPVYMYPASVNPIRMDTGKWGVIPVYVVCPEPCGPKPHVIFYIHGAGWVFGSFHTHEKLVRELAARTNSIVVFPEYTRSPEARYPVAIEQCQRHGKLSRQTQLRHLYPRKEHRQKGRLARPAHALSALY